MKKLFAVLLTLLLVFTMPLCIMAEETTFSAETSVTEIGDADTSASVTEATTEAVTETDTTAPTETESESEAETEYKMNFGFYPNTLKDTLPVMAMGMLGIFVVTCVIVLAVVVLSKIGKGKEED